MKTDKLNEFLVTKVNSLPISKERCSLKGIYLYANEKKNIFSNRLLAS